MATNKSGGGAGKNGRDSIGRRLGVKTSDGQLVPSGSIIVRQRGTKVLPGRHVGMGKDHTLFALSTGHIKFDRQGKRVNIVPASA
jgi:large subunit ribosomal protein L27